MKKIHWTCLVNCVFFQSQLHALHPQEFQKLHQELGEGNLPRISNSVAETNSEMKFQKCSLAETLMSTIETMERFWEKHDPDQVSPKLFEEIRNLMKLDKGTWEDKIIEILETLEDDKFERDAVQNHVLFESLVKLLEIEQVPIDAMLVVWRKVLEMGDSKSHAFKEFPPLQFWQDDIRKIKSSYGKKIIEHIKKLETERDLNDFAIMHRGLGKYSIKLTGGWSPESQKELFALWNDDKTGSYNGLTKNQVVQTYLIRAIHAHPDIDHNVSHVYKDWTVKTLRQQSKTVVNYINSLNHLQVFFLIRNSKPFISAQQLLHPYGLNIDPPMSDRNHLEIVKFWANYIVIFVMIKDLGETKMLQDGINMLVADNVQEAYRLMNEFLKNRDPLGSQGDVPVMAEFLEFCVENTDIPEQKKISKDALDDFRFAAK
ncbi:hypothetical protein DFH28DRAFT_982732 [Melampsora americana]|nr:hypothetical protein DFH28DRAFT_982732 [Melampsora americana]